MGADLPLALPIGIVVGWVGASRQPAAG